MIHYRTRIWSCLVAGLGLALLLGCARSSPTRYYLLAPLAERAAVQGRGESVAHKLVIGIGPVELPDYLDRPQIVTRAGANPLHLSEFDKWAEPLKGNLERVMKEDLAALLATDQISFGPRDRTSPPDYQVEMEVLRFDGEPGSGAMLDVRWSLTGKDSRAIVDSRRADYREPVSGKTYLDLVAAESRLLAALCRDIAAQIKASQR